MKQGDSGDEKEKRPNKGREPASDRSSDQAAEESAKQAREDDPESARRAFDVLERFASELEEILHSLEKAKSIPPPPVSDEPAPTKESPYRPSSFHFERSPISSRVDPGAMRPLASPPPASRSGLRLTSEAFFLILVAAISARIELRWLLIAGVETVAFLIVASVELAVARDRHPSGAPLIPAAPPLMPYPLAQGSAEQSQSALEDVEPLVWNVEKGRPVSETKTEPDIEPAPKAESNWPLAAIRSETEPGKTEIEPDEAESLAPLESAIEISAPPATPEDVAAETAEPLVPADEAIEQEEHAAEPEAESARRGRLFRRRTIQPAQPEEPEPAIEAVPKTEPGPESEAEPEPREHRRWFGAHHEAVEEDREELEPEPEPEPESSRGFHLFRHAEESEAPESAIETPPLDLPVEAPEEEAPALEAEPEPREHRRWFGARGGRVTEPSEDREPESQGEVEPAVMAEKIGAKRRPRGEQTESLDERAETETEPVSESPAEVEPAATVRRRFRPFRLADEIEAEAAPAAEAEPGPEPGRSRGFHLFRHAEASEAPESAIETPPLDLPVEAPEEEAPALEAEPEPKPEPGSSRSFHLFRHAEESETPESAIETSAPIEARKPSSYRRHRKRSETTEEETSGPGIAPVEAQTTDESEPTGAIEPQVVTEPGLGVGTEQPNIAAAETTAEIELPQRITIDEIERALDELGSRRRRERKRRWRFGAEAIKDVEEHPSASAADAELEEALRLESEFRLNAEQERRRREREYQRSLRN